MRQRIFTVEGSGEFPKDMLRYDRCWPLAVEDSDKINLTYEANPDATLKRRTVNLETEDLQAPTRHRWESFLWKVIKDPDFF